MLNTLADFVMKRPPTPAPLHLVHCTTSLLALQMLATDQISVSMCPVYKTNLAYLFYGRPAYTPSQGTEASALLDLAPVCFIVDPSLVTSALRILPFDSGGFSRYANILGPSLKLEDFELGADPTAPPRTITTFFETNRNYFDQVPKLSEGSIGFADATARGYARLLADSSIRNVDDRCGTIEIQFSAPLTLSASLRGIVAPAAVLDDPTVSNLIAAATTPVVPLSYRTYGRSDVGGMMHALYERVDAFLTDAGSLL